MTPKDGNFYGPKIDFRVKDAIGRPWQLGTMQVDFAQPELFDLSYVGEDGKAHRPVVLHRAILGSVERFLGILIEHTAGNFPFWLAPVQAVVLPVSDRFADAARAAAKRLFDAGLRVETDDRNEKLGARIRKAELAEGARHAGHRRKGGLIRGRCGAAAPRGRRRNHESGRVRRRRSPRHRGEEPGAHDGGERSIRRRFESTTRSGGRRSA